MSDGGMDSLVVSSRQLIYNKMYYLLCVEYELQCGDIGAHFIGLMLIVPVIR